jgi:hypothetical protein
MRRLNPAEQREWKRPGGSPVAAAPLTPPFNRMPYVPRCAGPATPAIRPDLTYTAPWYGRNPPLLQTCSLTVLSCQWISLAAMAGRPVKADAIKRPGHEPSSTREGHTNMYEYARYTRFASRLDLGEDNRQTGAVVRKEAVAWPSLSGFST